MQDLLLFFSFPRPPALPFSRRMRLMELPWPARDGAALPV